MVSIGGVGVILRVEAEMSGGQGKDSIQESRARCCSRRDNVGKVAAGIAEIELR